MPPTIQTTTPDRDKRPQRTTEKRSELVCKVKYCNTLPDIPFDPKFITYPFESRRFIEYNSTSLERNYKYEVLTEHDLGVTIDLINKDLYAPDYRQNLDIADEKLLEEDILTQQDSKRSRHHGRSVSWLRRTEYISTEQTRFQPQTMDKVEAKVGYSIKKNLKEETLYMDRESQIKAIQKTFVDSKQDIEKHYSKPNVHPVEILPVFPDFKLWKYPCAQVIFDSDPAPVGRPVPAQIEEMSQAMIRGVMDESGEQFVAYFLPTETTLEKRKADFVNSVEYTEDEEYDYKMAREYNWNVKSKASKGYEENYYLVMRPDGVYYNELETRVRLSKRRQKAGQQVNNTRLVVQHRPLNAQEHKMQRYREKQLEPPNEDEEEEDEEEEEEEEEQTTSGKQDEGKENSEKEKENQSGSDKDDSDKEDEKKEKDGNESDRAKSDREKGESERDESGRENESGSGSENEADNKNKADKADAASHTSRSRSSSRSRSRSQSVRRSRSRSQSVRRSRSRSQSAPRSRSPSAARSRSASRERSRSPSAQKSRSPSAERSRSPSGERSRSQSPQKSRSPSGERSRSPSAQRSPSAPRSRSPSAQRSRSPSVAKSRSPSAQRSRSGSRSRSESSSGSGSAASGSDSE